METPNFGPAQREGNVLARPGRYGGVGAIIGREREFEQAWQSLQKAQRHSVPTVVRITGISGIGKTALFERVLSQAGAGGWLVVRVDCHRIQAGTALIAARRALSACHEALGDRRERYMAGLEGNPGTGEHSEIPSDAVLLRLLEGVLVDQSVLLAFDDAQWIDTESRAVIQHILQSLADRPISVITTDRTDGVVGGAFQDVDAMVGLERLNDRDAAEIVTSSYPGAPAEIVRAIMERCAGHPLDLHALAESAHELNITTSEGLSTSLDTLIARYLRLLSPELREFLQICSLIAEPIEDRLLTQLWRDENILLNLIEGATSRYMLRGRDGLRFIHAAIAESIRRTIPLEIPYRRRILAALQLTESTIENFERIAEQAAACSDRDLQHSTLLLLAGEATRSKALHTAANAYRRALQVRAPASEDLIDFYSQYISTLTALNEMDEARAVGERALSEANTLGLNKGTGALASRLIMTMCFVENAASAHAIYERLLPRFSEPNDLAEMYTAALYLYSAELDVQRFENTARRLSDITKEPSGIHETRMHLFDALLRMRTGDTTRAQELKKIAARAAESASPLIAAVVSQASIIIDYLESGPRGTEERLHTTIRRYSLGTRAVTNFDYLAAVTYFVSGRWEDARAVIDDALLNRAEPSSYRRLLSIDIAMDVLSGNASSRRMLAEEECRELGEPMHTTLAPLAIWYAAASSPSDRKGAQLLVERSIALLRHPLEAFATAMPYGLVLAAKRLEDRGLLLRLADPQNYCKDESPWTSAHRTLAIAAAQHALGHKDARTKLLRVAAVFEDFRAPLLAAIARKLVSAATPSDDSLLARCGIDSRTRGGESVLSRREREVVALVAEGHTNREIAMQLVLSERTVEAHLANAFNKTGASSRTQLVRVFLETMNPVA